MLPFNPKLKIISRQLRKNMTDAEQFMWRNLRMKQLSGFQFYRQKNIGDFIVDFYCPSAKMIIEIDGSQHATETGRKKDLIRDHYLKNLGFTILHFSDLDVFRNINGVLDMINESLPKSPLPPFRKGGNVKV